MVLSIPVRPGRRPQTQSGVPLIIHFTNKQILDLLASLGVKDVIQDAKLSRLVVVVDRGSGEERIFVKEFKQQFVHEIENQETLRQEIQRNEFASRIPGKISLSPGSTMSVEVLKRDEQLSPEEREVKAAMIEKVENTIKQQKETLLCLTQMQIRYKEIISLLHTRPEAEMHAPILTPGGKRLWTRGVTSAARYCAAEMKRPVNAGKTQMEICTDFLASFVIQDEEQYLPDQLSNNVSQIRRLNDLAEE